MLSLKKVSSFQQGFGKAAYLETLLIILYVVVCFEQCLGQSNMVSGYVKDFHSGEPLIGVAVYAPAHKAGTLTNRYGYFSLMLPIKDTLITLRATYVGYSNVELCTSKPISALIIEMKSAQEVLNEVIIRADSANYENNLVGYHKINLQAITKLPVLFGEKDVLKAIQLLPGVQTGTEGTAGIYVRGGSPDQNLILLDGIPVYNVNHLFGFFSVFHPQAVSNIDFYKGSIPAQYGGRLSSVIDISLKEGNTKKFHHQYSFSPISGQFLIEGPAGNKTSYLVSGRRTWLDLLTTPLQKASSTSFLYKFYDFTAKINHTISPNSKIYASLYAGRDKFGVSTSFDKTDYKFGFDWGNITASLRHYKVFNQRLFCTNTVGFTSYNFNIINELNTPSASDYFRSSTNSNIRDWLLKTDWDLTVNEKTSLKFGGAITFHRFVPETWQLKGSLESTFESGKPLDNVELGAYFENNLAFSRQTNLTVGLHLAGLLMFTKTYFSPQPRLSLRHLLSVSSSLKFSYSRLTQYLHLLTNGSLGLPTDLWIPVTERVPPQNANQWALGYHQAFKEKTLEVSLEAYYRLMSNVIEYREGATFLNDFSTQWENRVTVGKGTAYGLELLLQKKTGKTQGWLSYTLSWSNRQFEQLNNSNPFPYRYDRRHNLSVVLTHSFTKSKSISCTFSLYSGAHYTLQTSKYAGLKPPNSSNSTQDYDDFFYHFDNLSYYPERNNFSLPLYHRLDVSYRTVKKTKKGTRTWSFGIYNLYNRQNAFALFYQKNQLKQMSLFPVLPIISYEYAR